MKKIKNNMTKCWKIVWREIGWNDTIDTSTIRSGWAIELQEIDDVYAWIENGCLAFYNKSDRYDQDIPLDMIEKLKQKENIK